MITKYTEKFEANITLEDIYVILKNKIGKSDIEIEFEFNGIRLFIDKNTGFYGLHSFYRKAKYISENKIDENNLQLGDFMLSFNYIQPIIGSEINYLLGNMIENLNITTFVTGRFNPDFGDFIKDEYGKYKYVSYWRYVDKQQS